MPLTLVVGPVVICWWFHIKVNGLVSKTILDMSDPRLSKTSSRNYCVLSGSTKLMPNLILFWGRIYVTDIRISNDFTLNIVLLNFILFHFTFRYPYFCVCSEGNIYTQGKTPNTACGQNAHTWRRFAPCLCQLVSCPNLAIIVTLNT